MKFDAVTYKNAINSVLSQSYIGGHSEFLELACKRMVKKLINKMSDMNIQETLYITISFDDKQNNLKNTITDLSNEIDFNDDFLQDLD